MNKNEQLPRPFFKDFKSTVIPVHKAQTGKRQLALPGAVHFEFITDIIHLGPLGKVLVPQVFARLLLGAKVVPRRSPLEHLRRSGPQTCHNLTHGNPAEIKP